MLMSEQDYADIGLPKEPRVKLLNSLRQLRGNAMESPTPPPPQQAPLLKHINPQPMWNSSMDTVVPNHLQHPESRLPPGLRNAPFHPQSQVPVSYFIEQFLGVFFIHLMTRFVGKSPEKAIGCIRHNPHA